MAGQAHDRRIREGHAQYYIRMVSQLLSSCRAGPSNLTLRQSRYWGPGLLARSRSCAVAYMQTLGHNSLFISSMLAGLGRSPFTPHISHAKHNANKHVYQKHMTCRTGSEPFRMRICMCSAPLRACALRACRASHGVRASSGRGGGTSRARNYNNTNYNFIRSIEIENRTQRMIRYRNIL